MGKLWLNVYCAAKEFFLENGNLNVPRNYVTASGIKLGNWICRQRMLYNKGELSDEQIVLLTEIKMIWDLKSYEWYEKYLEAKKYFCIYGNLDVPRNYVTVSGFKLGNWVKLQKEAFKNRFTPRSEWTHDLNPLTDEQVQLLEELNIVWNPRENNWFINFSYAKRFFLENGNLDVPRNYVTSDGFPLYNWLEFQRKSYRNINRSKDNRVGVYAPLSDWQVELLNGIGMMWIKKNVKWEKGFLYAEKYFLENGDLLVPRGYVTSDGFRLGYWICTQRYAYSNVGLSKEEYKYSFAPLTPDQIFRLESIGMVWIVREKNFLTTSFNLKKKIKLRNMFLEYLNEYSKSGKVSFDSYDDVLSISNGFMKSLGK